MHGLYEAEIQVPDQTKSVRLEALKQALAVVLVKVTGNRGVVGDEEMFTAFLNRAPEKVTIKSAPASSRHFATRPVPQAATNTGLPLLIFL